MTRKNKILSSPPELEFGHIENWVNSVNGRFEEAYRYLRGVTNFRPAVCFVGAWMSLSNDDRGESLHTWTLLANWLGVSRTTLYNWRGEFSLDDWAAQLRLMELHGEQLGEVDRVTYLQAIDMKSPVDARRLYYQRAGVLGQDVTIHDKTQKEKMDEWLKELREVPVESPAIEVDKNDE